MAPSFQIGSRFGFSSSIAKTIYTKKNKMTYNLERWEYLLKKYGMVKHQSSNIYHQMICVCTSFFGQKRWESYRESNQIGTFFNEKRLE